MTKTADRRANQIRERTLRTYLDIAILLLTYHVLANIAYTGAIQFKSPLAGALVITN